MSTVWVKHRESNQRSQPIGVESRLGHVRKSLIHNSCLPEKSQQGTPKWREEGFLYAGKAQVFRAGSV